MTSRERVRQVLEHQVPDSVPHALYDVAIGVYNDSTLDLFQKKLGKHPRDCFRHDLRGFRLPPRPTDGDWPKRIAEIQSVDDVQRTMGPWIPCRYNFSDLKDWVARTQAAGYAALVCSSISDFETPFHLRGREQFFMDLGYEEPWLSAFITAIADAAVEEATLAARAGADIFTIGDDLGSQRSLLLSPELWRRLFKPCLKRIAEAAHRGGNTRFFLHTDGQVSELIPDFIAAGVDILNPIQPEVLDPARVKADYGRQLVFCGAISVQHTLPHGTPQDVEREVQLRMQTIGAGGGYLMTPSHLINADIPWENIVAFFEAAERFGRYS